MYTEAHSQVSALLSSSSFLLQWLVTRCYTALESVFLVCMHV